MNILNNPTQEEWFDIWAEELVKAGYIDEIVSPPNVPTFELFKDLNKPIGKKKNVILHPVVYTPDRIIKWNNKAMGIFFTPFDGDAEDWDKCYFKPQYTPDFYYSILDIKGPTGTQKAYGSDFRFTQKWLWADTNQYVQKVMLAPALVKKVQTSYLWASTFTPERYLYSDKLSINKNKSVPFRTIPNKKGIPLWEIRSLENYLKLLK